MADEEEVEIEESGGGKKKIIFFALAALILVGGAIGGTLFFVGGDSDPEASAEATETETAEVSKGNPTYVDLKPPFTVNLNPDDSVGFLQISLQALTYDEDVADEIEKHKPLIRNNLVVLFGEQKSIELRAPEGKEQLQKSVLETVQTIIDEYGSGGEVDNVFFTSFVMQ